MKYLSDNITVTINNIVNTDNGTYIYKIYSSRSELPIFVGRTYLSAGESIKTFDITDICQNYAFINKYSVLENRGNSEFNKTFVTDTYNIVLTVGEREYEGTSDQVYLVYQYPHLTSRFDESENTIVQYIQQGLLPTYPMKLTSEYGINSIFFYAEEYPEITYSIIKNGNDIYYGDAQIFRDYPYTTNIYKKLNEYVKLTIPQPYFFQHTQTNCRVDNQRTLNFWQIGNRLTISKMDTNGNIKQLFSTTVGPTKKSQNLGFMSENASMLIFRVDQGEGSPSYAEIWCNWELNIDTWATLKFDYQVLDEYNEDIYITNIDVSFDMEHFDDGVYIVNNWIDDEYTTKIGNVCDNLDGYYLQWQDRYGTLQSQHFAGNPIVSNKYDVQTITNYRGKKRPIYNQQTTSFEINSGWINEKQYVNYESIFVSPYLVLYDVKEDKSYQVIVTDKEFTEKTFHNQGRQLFNLNLKLELDKTQNIIY